MNQNLTTPEVVQLQTESRNPWHLAPVVILLAGVIFSFALTDSVSHNSLQEAAASSALEKDPFGSLFLSAKSVYVADITTGEVLFAYNPDAQLPLASLTKIPLVLVVSEVLAPDDHIRISREAVVRGEGGDLGEGELWRVQDLIDFTLLTSSNTGAEALAEAADEKLRARYFGAPEKGATVWRMNALAQERGLTRTYFLNPSGLDASETQPGAVASAQEVALLLIYAAHTAPELFASTLHTSMTFSPLNNPARVALNTNEALADIPGLIIGKTGYTDLAGGNLALVFEIGPNHPVAAVVLGSTEKGRFEDMKKIVTATQESLTQE